MRLSVAEARGNKESSSTGNTWEDKGSTGDTQQVCDEVWAWHWGHRREMVGWGCEETWGVMGLKTWGVNMGDMF